jgi:hypothetical protein
MTYKDYLSLKNEVLRETDAEAEDFLQPQEIIDYFNDAVREAAAHIQKLGLEDDYFQKSTTYNLNTGQTFLAMPPDIYATKIRAVTYSTPSEVYPIRRIKGPNKFQIIQNLLQNPYGNPKYVYDLDNSDPATGFRMMLYPPSQETSPNAVVVNYIRNVQVITLNTDLVDIPEFYSFIKAFVKMKIHSKENDSKAVEARADYEKEKQLMMETLSEMTPDYDNKIIGDYSFYEDHT